MTIWYTGKNNIILWERQKIILRKNIPCAAAGSRGCQHSWPEGGADEKAKRIFKVTQDFFARLQNPAPSVSGSAGKASAAEQPAERAPIKA